ncbi:ABC transporter substrate-binding protein [Demequina lutea]|uniref:Multiple sugar transport system substrate-binding protein n=1 Tax=Demequina lutea TaxID=431489 RepID=A0A7Y9ZAK4_9MICO|nr:sugar ABC transporter substrate-binding protein [Demequina lutea]NYI41859.1 multiple sugar transport system substrate-binding protein [Demequina lutea]
MRKSAIAGVGLAAALGMTLAACSNSSPDPTGSSSGAPVANAPVTITYSNFISNSGNEGNLKTIVDAFEAANPNITVDVKTLPYSDYFTALQTDLAGGTQADVFDIEYANYRGYQADGVLAPLKGVDTSAYRASLVDAYATDGTSYALPTSFSTVVLFYNKDLFDKAGVSYPTSSWTWADEKAAAEKLTQGDVFGDYQPISYYEFYKTLVQAGGSFLNADGTAVAFNSPEGIAAAHWLVDKSGSVMPTAEQGAGTPDFDTGLFTAGKLAMWHTGIWLFGTLAADTSLNWDIAVEPGSAQQASAVFSNAVGVSATSEHKDAAQKFAEFLTSSKIMVDIRLNSGWELPAIADDAQLAPYLDKGAPANRQAVFDSLKGVALPPTIGDNQAQMQDLVGQDLTEAAAGRMTVEEALAKAEKEINKLLG